MPATASGMMKEGSPMLLSLREQSVECDKQDGAEPVQPAGWRELHRSPERGNNCAPV